VSLQRDDQFGEYALCVGWLDFCSRLQITDEFDGCDTLKHRNRVSVRANHEYGALLYTSLLTGRDRPISIADNLDDVNLGTEQFGRVADRPPASGESAMISTSAM